MKNTEQRKHKLTQKKQKDHYGTEDSTKNTLTGHKGRADMDTKEGREGGVGGGSVLHMLCCAVLCCAVLHQVTSVEFNSLQPCGM